MITLNDIFHKITHDSTGAIPEEAVPMEELVRKNIRDFNIGITDDVEESEYTFRGKYGDGQTFYFTLESYQQGKALAGEFYSFLAGQEPDMSAYTGSQFKPSAPLYLFVHIRPLLEQQVIA